MKVIKAMRNDPMAIEPIWYHIAHENAFITLTPLGLSDISSPCPV
jgi:hypothetical protein